MSIWAHPREQGRCKQWWDTTRSQLMPEEFAATPLTGMAGLSLFQFNWGQRDSGGFLWCFEIIQKEKCRASVTCTLLIRGCCSAAHNHTCMLLLCTAEVQVAVREHDKGIKLQVGSCFLSLLVCMCVCVSLFFLCCSSGGLVNLGDDCSFFSSPPVWLMVRIYVWYFSPPTLFC